MYGTLLTYISVATAIACCWLPVLTSSSIGLYAEAAGFRLSSFSTIMQSIAPWIGVTPVIVLALHLLAWTRNRSFFKDNLCFICITFFVIGLFGIVLALLDLQVANMTFHWHLGTTLQARL